MGKKHKMCISVLKLAETVASCLDYCTKGKLELKTDEI